jgi:hypothetical protein
MAQLLVESMRRAPSLIRARRRTAAAAPQPCPAPTAHGFLQPPVAAGRLGETQTAVHGASPSPRPAPAARPPNLGPQTPGDCGTPNTTGETRPQSGNPTSNTDCGGCGIARAGRKTCLSGMCQCAPCANGNHCDRRCVRGGTEARYLTRLRYAWAAGVPDSKSSSKSMFTGLVRWSSKPAAKALSTSLF